MTILLLFPANISIKFIFSLLFLFFLLDNSVTILDNIVSHLLKNESLLFLFSTSENIIFPFLENKYNDFFSKINELFVLINSE
jgi:hypothetical protein